ncbi:MAG TPA: methyltransferase domain-containing protein [Gaiellales bacterium]|nr:methyltransferase domain-containing protein [Gaiellales bacterium]
MDEYARINNRYWDERVQAHAASPDYAVARFADDPQFLSGVVRYDLPRLGDLSGLDLVHLQCHIGTDTVSLARLGARVTGVDLSAPALEEARRLADAAGVQASFVQSELYDAPRTLGDARFDMVYTGIGALCWLPDIRRWGAVVAALLRPGGRLHIREGHPVLWSLADVRADDPRLLIEHPYFETAEGQVWDDGEVGLTYVQTDQVFQTTVTHEWNHGLAEIVTALLDAGMEVTRLEEHDSVPWEALPGHMTRLDGGEWQLTDRPERLPHSYTLQARRAG